MMRFILMVALFAVFTGAYSQSQTSYDSLKLAIQNLDVQLQDVDLRMESSRKRFQSGILVSTLGYSVTIAGGLMLGRENDKLGQGLLVAGGITGLTGTYLLMDAFNFLSGKKRKKGNHKL